MTVSLPIFSPPVDADAVAKLTDRFRCEPYRCILTAAGCIAKRRRAGTPAKQGEVYTQGHRAEAGSCPACSVGISLEKLLGAEVDGGAKTALAVLPPDAGASAVTRRGRPAKPRAYMAPEQEIVHRDIKPENVDLEAMVAEARQLQADIGRNIWKLGKVLARIETSRAWKRTYKRWDDFTMTELRMTGGYVRKLIDVAANFTERQTVECGTAKLIKILPVPTGQRGPFVALAKEKSLTQVRAAVNRFNIENYPELPGGGRVLPARETGRKFQKLTRAVITHVDSAEHVVRLYRGKSTDRAMSIADTPRGWVNLGGKVYIVRLRATAEGLFLGVKASGK